MNEKFLKYCQEYELEDGTKVKTVLTNRHLIALSAIDKKLYKELCVIAFTGVDDFDVEKFAKVIYGAYVCANMEDHMTYEEFLDVMNPNIAENGLFAAELVNTSKK